MEHWDQEDQSAHTANLQLGGHKPVLGLQPIHGQLQVELAEMKFNLTSFVFENNYQRIIMYQYHRQVASTHWPLVRNCRLGNSHNILESLYIETGSNRIQHGWYLAILIVCSSLCLYCIDSQS